MEMYPVPQFHGVLASFPLHSPEARKHARDGPHDDGDSGAHRADDPEGELEAGGSVGIYEEPEDGHRDAYDEEGGAYDGQEVADRV